MFAAGAPPPRRDVCSGLETGPTEIAGAKWVNKRVSTLVRFSPSTKGAIKRGHPGRLKAHDLPVPPQRVRTPPKMYPASPQVTIAVFYSAAVRLMNAQAYKC